MVAEVDPRAPRFGQAITAVLAFVGIFFQEGIVIYLVGLLLAVPVVSRWRVDPYGVAWERGFARLFDPPARRESAIPHRFARLVDAVFATGASALLLTAAVAGVGQFAVVGYGLALVVGLLALLGATTACPGCRLYRHVGVFCGPRLLIPPKRQYR